MTASRDHAGIVVPPPLICLGFLFAGWGVGVWVGEPSLGLTDLTRRAIALGLLVLGLILEGWAAGLFKRARTDVLPWKPSTALVTTGPYRFTRNPIYLGYTITYVGLGVGLDSPMALAFVLPCLIVMERFVIAREEAYLETRFGSAYRAYLGTVRRWL